MPRLTRNYYLNFYGGEPLLCFKLIEKILSYLGPRNKELKKRANFSITTNGSLLTGEIIRFLSRHNFSLVLSFDGLAQDVQRKKGSFKKTVSAIEKLLAFPNIDLEVNSVFTPATVDYLSESIKLSIDLGVSDVNFSLSIIEPWDEVSLLKLKNEISRLRKPLLLRYKKKGDIPLLNFREEPGKGIFYCAGGKGRLSVTPDEEVWGCQLFPEHFRGKENSPEYRRFFFGTLDDFIKNHNTVYPRISSHYTRLSTDNYSTSRIDCFLCPELEDCEICPINAAFSGSPLMRIPSYVCEIQKIRIKEKKKFWKEMSLQKKT